MRTQRRINGTAEASSADQPYRAVFEATGDGILIVDAASRLILEANPAICRMLGYAHEELVGADPRSFVHPSSYADFDARIHAEPAPAPGDPNHGRVGLVGVRKDGGTIDVEVQVQALNFGGIPTRLAVVRNVTERVRAVELLERRVGERTRELSTLVQVSQGITGTLELQPLLGLILDRLREVVDYTAAAVMLVDGDEVCVVEYRGPAARESVVSLRGPANEAPVFKLVMRANAPVIISNLLESQAIAADYRTFQARTGADPSYPLPAGVLAVPLRVKDRIIGQLRLDHIQTDFYSPEHADLVYSVACQAAIAIENARLFEGERLIRERLEVALEAGQMGTWEWDKSSGRVIWSPQLEAIHGLQPGTFAGTLEGYFSDVHPDDHDFVERAIVESLERGEHHVEYRIIWPDGSIHWVEARGQVIRDAQGQPIGMRGVCLDVTKRKLAEEEHRRLVDNERKVLETNAALEERQRLARELHDSVSQALYGIDLGALTALGALEEDNDPAAAASAVRYVLSLAQAGLAEMRALIFELRPESLERDGLVAAIERHAASVRARHRIEVTTQLGNEPDLLLSVKEALYRITQEALHNTVRHAHARSVNISLEVNADQATLNIVDDGSGFDLAQSRAGHLGLTSMTERAEALGGELTIDSQPGKGTRVRAVLPR